MYDVTFEDGSVFHGAEPINSLWDELPNKPIKSISYWVNDSKFLLENFEEYNHCVERVRGVNVSMDIVSRAMIMGRIGSRVYQVVFDLRTGAVTRLVVPYGQEYSSQFTMNHAHEGKPLTGWRIGLFNQPAKLKMLTE